MKHFFIKHQTNVIIVSIIIISFICIMISFAHADVFDLFYIPYFFFRENVYQFAIQHKQVCVWLDAPYPPLYYIFVGTYLNVLRILNILPYSLFTHNACPFSDLVYNKVFLFYVKFPYLIAHVSSAFIFSLFYSKKRFLWFLLWLLNPVSIFVSFIMGQFEILSVVFLLGSFYAMKKESYMLSGVCLGIAGAMKHYPFLLVFPFLWILNSWKKSVVFLIFMIIPYALSIPPLYSHEMISNITSFNENTKMLGLGFTIGNMKISVYTILYILLLIKLLFERKKDFDTFIQYIFLFSGLYFITSSWFVQRFLFLIPSLLLIASKNKKVFFFIPIISVLYFLYVLIVWQGNFDNLLLLPLIPTLKQFNYTNIQPTIDMFQGFISSALIAILLYIGIIVVKNNTEKIEVVIKGKHIYFTLIPLILYICSLALLSAFA